MGKSRNRRVIQWKEETKGRENTSHSEGITV